MAWLTREQIEAMGFAHVGPDALLSDRASYYNCARIRIGARSRVDDHVVMSAGEGGIDIGSNVHIAVFSSLLGRGRICLEDFSGLSARVSVFSSSDDYTGAALTNPTVPTRYSQVDHLPVTLKRHVIVGAGSVVLPGVTLEEGCAIGALSVVRSDGLPFTIYSGNPARRVGERRRDLLVKEQAYLAELGVPVTSPTVHVVAQVPSMAEEVDQDQEAVAEPPARLRA